MKQTLLILLLIAILVITKAQIPAGYYANATGKTVPCLKPLCIVLLKDTLMSGMTVFTTHIKPLMRNRMDQYWTCTPIARFHIQFSQIDVENTNKNAIALTVNTVSRKVGLTPQVQ